MLPKFIYHKKLIKPQFCTARFLSSITELSGVIAHLRDSPMIFSLSAAFNVMKLFIMKASNIK